MPEQCVITTDVGQNQVWIAQSMEVKEHQRVLFSGGHGAMGYSLPAAIGAAIATGGPVICVTGDGGIQMNLQELQFIVREALPVKIILLNNRSLGMIHHFQEMYFHGNYVQTDASKGFTIPDFIKVALAYGIKAVQNPSQEELISILSMQGPALVELELPDKTHVYPKLGLHKSIHDQEPPLSLELFQKLESILQNDIRVDTD